MPDPTDEADVLSSEQVQALGELSDIIADHLPTWLDNDYRRSLAHSIRDELLCDDYRPLLARAVAGRPDQPTPLFEGTVDDLWAKVDRACSFDHPDPDRDPDWWLDRRVTVYATDPHTPGQENP